MLLVSLDYGPLDSVWPDPGLFFSVTKQEEAGSQRNRLAWELLDQGHPCGMAAALAL